MKKLWNSCPSGVPVETFLVLVNSMYVSYNICNAKVKSTPNWGIHTTERIAIGNISKWLLFCAYDQKRHPWSCRPSLIACLRVAMDMKTIQNATGCHLHLLATNGECWPTITGRRSLTSSAATNDDRRHCIMCSTPGCLASSPAKSCHAATWFDSVVLVLLDLGERPNRSLCNTLYGVRVPLSRRLFDPPGSMMTLLDKRTHNRERKEITSKPTMIAICDSYWGARREIKSLCSRAR
jgi:hypothetical protein